MTKNEKVSVVVCTYNGSKYLRAQLDSILQQTYPLYEIIVQDDHSTDDTYAIACEYAKKNPLIKVFSNEAEKGVNGNFFSAMLRAQGDYIALSDQDDLWRPEKIALQMAAIGDCLLCSGRSKPFTDDNLFVYDDSRVPNHSLIRFIFGCLPGHTFLFKRELITDILPFDNEIYHVSYYDLALVFAAAAYDRVAYVNQTLVDFRRHQSAQTFSDYSSSLPSWRNAIHQLMWSVSHYHAAKQIANRYFHSRLALLNALDADTVISKEVRKILQLELNDGVINFFLLMYYFYKHRHSLFYFEGRRKTNGLRALLYPVMQYYNYYYHYQKIQAQQ